MLDHPCFNSQPYFGKSISFIHVCCFLFSGATAPQWARASSFTKFLDHTQRRTIFGRTTLDEWSARRRDLYLTKHNTHNRQTSMPSVEFEPTISAGERRQTYALERAAAGTGLYSCSVHNYFIKPWWIRRLRLELNFGLLISFETPWKADSAIARLRSARNNKIQKCADSPLCPKTMSKCGLCGERSRNVGA